MIADSIAEVGIIEPSMVFPDLKQPALLDGHLRVEILKDRGESEVFCLLAADDEAYPSAPLPRWWHIEDAAVAVGGHASRAGVDERLHFRYSQTITMPLAPSPPLLVPEPPWPRRCPPRSPRRR
jgi:hypothetical protein